MLIFARPWKKEQLVAFFRICVVLVLNQVELADIGDKANGTRIKKCMCLHLKNSTLWEAVCSIHSVIELPNDIIWVMYMAFTYCAIYAMVICETKLLGRPT